MPVSPAKRLRKAPDHYLLSPEFLAGEEDEAENLLAMERMLGRTRGFALAFARVNMPSQRAELVREIRRRIESQGIEIVEIEFSSPVQDVLAELRRRLQGKYLPWQESEEKEFTVAESLPRLAIFVYGLEHSLPSSEIYHPVLAVLNYKREGFRRYIPAPLIFWTPEFALQAIMEGAPDFWAWRSALFEFVAPQEQVQETWTTLEPERGQISLSRLSGKEKRERIHLLSGLLAEYEAREDKERAEISAIRIDLGERIGMLYYFLGEYNHALDYYQQMLSLARSFHFREGEAVALHQIGMMHQDRGDYAVALLEYEKSLKIKEEIGDRAGVAQSRGQIGMVHQDCGDYAMALLEYEKSLKIFEEIGDRTGIAYTLGNIGNIYQATGRYDLAIENYQKVLKTSEKLGDKSSLAKALHQIGNIHSQRGDYAAALVEYEKSLKIAEEIDDRAGIALTLHQIGNIHYLGGDYLAALGKYTKSLKIKEEISNRAGVASSRMNIGNIFIETRRFQEALDHLLFALLEFVQMQSPNARIAVIALKELRQKWGIENFDPAWQKATGKAVPEELKE